MIPVPVVLFVFNRPKHTQRTVEALVANPEAKDTDLIIYSDAPRASEHIENVLAVRSYLKTIQGFRTVKIVERDTNFGLFRNIREGLGDAFLQNEALIVLEDDLTPTSNFLAFMNGALDFYQKEESVGAVSAFQYPVPHPFPKGEDVFLFRRFSCWGWATWKDRWLSWNWDLPDRKSFLKMREPLRSLHQASNDLPEILLDRIDGLNRSWSIQVCLDFVQKNQFCVYPTVSKVQNWGFDGTGVHSHKDDSFAVEQDSGQLQDFRFTMNQERSYQVPLERYFRNSWKRKVKNLVRYGRWF